ncbi:MAG TPA: glycosyltransferase family 1 protein [Armatimonadota bacterium]|nr:glycosyltransferase family 1 protein [Armatimonadota bacterium]
MRIGLDARPIQGRFTGDATYWRGLIEGLSRLDSGDEFFIYLDAALPMPELPAAANLRPRPLRAVCWRAWSAWSFPRALRRDGIEVAHVQYTIPPVMPCPVITSIHDVSFRRHPEFFPLKDRLILDMGVRCSRRQAFRILALSAYTKKELLDLYRIPHGKVAVVYPGVDEQFKPLDRAAAREFVDRKYGIRFPFVLTVGVIQPRKNLQRLLDGFAALKGILPSDHKLAIVGKYGWKQANLERRIHELGLTADVVFTGYVPCEDLPAFYSAADVFVYPSVYEGFGLPPLEAMACGAPVITGNRSSLPEVVGEAGIMVDPFDPEAFARAMADVLSSESLRAEMSVRGLDQARKFSWDKTARDVARIYHRARKKV